MPAINLYALSRNIENTALKSVDFKAVFSIYIVYMEGRGPYS
jgi:hypothetical protein